MLTLNLLTTTESIQMSLDKLILAATDFFTTGAEVHRRALAGGGGKITDLSEKKVAENDPEVGTTSKTKTKKVESATDVVAKPTAEAQAVANAIVQHEINEAKRAAEVQAAKPVAAAVQVPDAVGGDDDLDGTNLDYETDIRPVLRAKTLSNRAGLVALLADLGVKSGAELKPEQYTAFFEKLVAL